MSTTFRYDRTSSARLGADPRLRAYMGRVADVAEQAAKAAAPRIVTQGRGKIRSEVKLDRGVPVAYLKVKSSFWHFPEYGHARYAPRPYLRPAAVAVLNRAGGRFASKSKGA